MFRTPASLRSLFLAVLLVSACGGDGPGESGDPTGPGGDTNGPGSTTAGSFSAQVTGAENMSFTGNALFAVTSNGIFHVYLFSGNPLATVWVKRLGDTPGVGSYPIDGMPYDGEEYWGEAALTGSYYFSLPTSAPGTLTITESSSSRLVGTLEFEGVDDEGQKVTVTASFQATQ